MKKLLALVLVMVLSLTALVSCEMPKSMDDLKDKFNDLIAKNGTVENVDDWGKRRLAYPINDEVEGYYIVVTFTGAPSFPAELDRVVKITDGALRVMVTVK